MLKKFVGGVRRQLSVISYQFTKENSPHPTPHTPQPTPITDLEKPAVGMKTFT
ncbi:hypothetical protein C789_2114 [Microcystis aeruginosa FACHB-905 = DIANCHI905]|nr:hypothetical protein C789_2114 [Microcystis aeruginosa FACHB-905 = DIANCHI905]